MIETRFDENVPARACGTCGRLRRRENQMNLHRRGCMPKSRDRVRHPARKLERRPSGNGGLDPDPASGNGVVTVLVGAGGVGANHAPVEAF